MYNLNDNLNGENDNLQKQLGIFILCYDYLEANTKVIEN